MKLAAITIFLFGSAAVQHVGAVCASGQLAVGTEELTMFTGPNGSFEEYAGFLMTNACALVSQNGLTQDSNQMCKHGYDSGADVTCNSSHQPTNARDTQGNNWNCSPTSDISCNVGGSGGSFRVVACCSRA